MIAKHFTQPQGDPADKRIQDTDRTMRHRFDQIGKRIGREALGRSGSTFVHDEISPDAQHADLRHEPDPARAAARRRLGLLGRIASVPCLIELYGHAPNGAEFRTCLGKHIAAWQQRARRRRRRGRRERRRAPAGAEPFLWIIAAGMPRALVAGLRLEPAPGWPTGVYLFGAHVLRVGLVVASKLLRDRSTLLVRLMAAGLLLADAIEDLSALPADAHEHVVADQILLALKDTLRQKPRPTAREKEFIVKMYGTWADARELGRVEARADALLTVLRLRGIRVPVAARKRITAEKDPGRLKRWLERAAVAGSLDEVLDRPRRG